MRMKSWYLCCVDVYSDVLIIVCFATNNYGKCLLIFPWQFFLRGSHPVRIIDEELEGSRIL